MSPQPGDQSSRREIDSSANDELTLDKETLKDLEAPSTSNVAGQMGMPETAICVTLTCRTCTVTLV